MHTDERGLENSGCLPDRESDVGFRRARRECEFILKKEGADGDDEGADKLFSLCVFCGHVCVFQRQATSGKTIIDLIGPFFFLSFIPRPRPFRSTERGLIQFTDSFPAERMNHGIPASRPHRLSMGAGRGANGREDVESCGCRQWLPSIVDPVYLTLPPLVDSLPHFPYILPPPSLHPLLPYPPPTAPDGQVLHLPALWQSTATG